LKIYLATTLADKTQGESLTKYNAPDRLLSYYYLSGQGATGEHLKEYLSTGTTDLKKYERKPIKHNKNMETTFKKFNPQSMKLRGGDIEYFIEKEQKDPGSGDILSHWNSLYDLALWREEQRVLGFEGWEPSVKLDQIKEEIKIRTKININEIFKIGELLWMAKKVCQESGTGFKEWINDNFDFSYETANNIMSVFKQCYTIRDIAMKIPISILYKISSPSFPDELRDYLLDKGNLEKITNGTFKKLTEKYRTGGIKAIENDVEELRESALVYRQTLFTFDICESALRTLIDLKFKIESRYSKYMAYEDQVKGQQPIASDINSKLYESVTKAIELLDTAKSESTELLNNYWESVKEKM
jgi:hypothetical protein